MNAVKISLLNFKKNLFTYILVLLEISVLFLSVNYLVSVLKESEMYTAPFRCVLNENTVFVNDEGFAFNQAFYGMTGLQSRDKLLSDISDKYKIYDVMTASSGDYTVISLSDEIYDGLAMPLLNGNYKSAVGTFGTKVGEHEIKFSDGTSMKIRTSGTLTVITSIPEMNSIKNNMTAKDFYYTSVNDRNVILTNRTSISGFEHKFSVRSCFFIEFKANVAGNTAKLQNNGAQATPADLIADNSQKALKAELSGSVPLVCLIAFISLLGIVFVSVITFKNNERRNAVFRLCGYSGMRIIGIHCFGIMLLTVLAMGAAAAAFGVMKLFEIEAAVGLALSLLNLIVSLITIAALVLAAAVVPMILTAKKTPAEYFRKVL